MVSRDHIQALADQIAAKFPQVEKIILFGSYAYGTPTQDSDVDLLVVMEYEGSFLQREVEVWEKLRPEIRTDMIVMRPAEYRRRYAQFNPIAREAHDRGALLYDRRAARVA